MRLRVVLTASLATWLLPLTALAWEPFRSPNGLVEEGNELLAQEKTAEALEAYTRAAKELPDRAGVHLNRGLALDKAGELDAAGEAFEQATRGRGGARVRADSYYNLGRTRFAQANQLADSGDLKGAQSLLGDARDALRQALRAKPGFRDAAWNLELVQRRMVELKEEQKKQEQDQEQEQEQDQDQDQQDQDQQDQDQQDQESQGEGEQDPQQPQDGEPQDEESPPQDRQAGDDGSSSDEPEPEQPEEGKQGQDPQEQPSPEQEPAPQEQPQQGEAPQEPLPQHVRQVLDSLQDSEETLQRHQAHSRARRRPRRVEKDW